MGKAGASKDRDGVAVTKFSMEAGMFSVFSVFKYYLIPLNIVSLFSALALQGWSQNRGWNFD